MGSEQQAPQEGDPRRSSAAARIEPPETCFQRAQRYEQGAGPAQDLIRAAFWYHRAAVQGHPEAANALGYLYATGQGVRRDEAVAATWFRHAARHGHPDAQANLALLYGEGRGVPRDLGEAVKWLVLAARQGSPEAQAFLARAYTEGLYGLEPDPWQATYWRHNAVFSRARRRARG